MNYSILTTGNLSRLGVKTAQHFCRFVQDLSIKFSSYSSTQKPHLTSALCSLCFKFVKSDVKAVYRYIGLCIYNRICTNHFQTIIQI